MEIERKWVPEALPPGEHESRRVEQGYVALDDAGAEVRVRRADDQLTLTVKSAPGLVRVEQELPLEEEQFAALWALTEGRRVVKTRHLLPLGDDLTVELDVYEDHVDGLLTAEAEFSSEAAARAFSPRRWL